MSLAASTNPTVALLNPIRDAAAADAGVYFVAVTPTPGTGIVSGNPTTLVATTPMLVLYNGGSLTVYLAYLRLLSTVVGGGAATKNFTHQVDTGNRYASGGTALTIKNVNATNTGTSSVQAYTGAITAGAASGSVRNLQSDFFRVAAADVVGDIYEWTFGGASIPSSQITTATHFVHAAPPVVLAPSASYILNVWSGTFTQGITFIVELGFIEK